MVTVKQLVHWDGDPAEMISQINALGYGVTLGIQARIDSRAQALWPRARMWANFGGHEALGRSNVRVFRWSATVSIAVLSWVSRLRRTG